jgi:single-strand DNA-binding protein
MAARTKHGFKGELTMLDTRGGGGEAASEGGYRSDRGTTPQRATAGAGRGGGGPSWEAPKGGDLDDEIPF